MKNNLTNPNQQDGNISTLLGIAPLSKKRERIIKETIREMVMGNNGAADGIYRIVNEADTIEEAVYDVYLFHANIVEFAKHRKAS